MHPIVRSVESVTARFIKSITNHFDDNPDLYRARVLDAYTDQRETPFYEGETSEKKVDQLSVVFKKAATKKVRILEDAQSPEFFDGRVLRAAAAFLRSGKEIELYLVGDSPRAQAFVRRLSSVAQGSFTACTVSNKAADSFDGSLLLVDDKAYRFQGRRNSPAGKIVGGRAHEDKVEQMKKFLGSIASQSMPYKLAPATEAPSLWSFLPGKLRSMPAEFSQQ